jgi:hypothetical protein
MQFTALNDYVTLPIITSLNVVRVSVIVENALQCDFRHEIGNKTKTCEARYTKDSSVH